MGNNAYKQRHIDQGLCVNDSHPAMEGETLCLHCWVKRVIRQQDIRFKHCTRCGCQLDVSVDDNHIECLTCRLRKSWPAAKRTNQKRKHAITQEDITTNTSVNTDK